MRPQATADEVAKGYGRRPPEADAIDWRAATQQHEIDGIRLNLARLGDPSARRPLVLIHGLSGSWLNWKLVMAGLATGQHQPTASANHSRHVIAVDLPGFGGSPLPASDMSIRDYAQLIDRLCDSLGLGEVALAGHSMGGYVATELAAEHPKRVAALVLSAAAGISSSSINVERMISNANQLALASRVVPLAIRSRLMRSAKWRRRVLGVYVAHGNMLDPRTANELAEGSGSPGYASALRGLADRNVHEQAKRVGCPALITWGDRDRVIPVRQAERYAALIPGSQLEIFSNCGHTQMVEIPMKYAQVVDQFLLRHGR